MLRLLVLIYATLSFASSNEGPLFIRCGRLIDGISNTPLTKVDILVSPTTGRIQKIGQALEIPSGAHIIDLNSYTVLPGLIDMHTHLTTSPEDYADLKAHGLLSEAQVLKKARKNAQAMLAQGFTTVRDVGTYHGWSNAHLKGEINEGLTPGPRMLVAPFYLTIPGGGGDDKSFSSPNLRLGVARSPKGFRAKAREAIRGGADLLKVIASGAVLSSGKAPGEPEMSQDEIRAVVEVAHQARKKVAAHAHGAQSIKDALRAGVDTIEHASLIDDEGLALAKKLHVALDMDIYNGDFIDQEGKRLHWPQEYLEKNKNLTETQRQNFTKALKLGIPLIYGTDAGIYPYGQNARQFKIMVERGMKPMDAIKSATSLAAQYLGWSQNVGTLTPGHFADLIAVSGDPLKDITELERIKMVFKGGQKFPKD